MTFQRDADRYVQKLIGLIAVLSAVSIIAGFLLLYQKEKEREKHYFHRQRAELAMNFKASKRLHYTLLSNFFHHSVNIPAVLEVLSKVQNSSPQEIERLRARLYDMVYPAYTKMLGTNLFYMRFYTSEGEVLLRFHRATHYGDCLSINNPVIQESITTKEPVSGLEKGFSHGIINYLTFPLFWNGQYLGCVVMSVPPQSMIDALTELDPNCRYVFLLQKDKFGTCLVKNEKGKSHVVPEETHGDSYPLLELNPVGTSGDAKIFNTLLLENKSMWKSFMAEEEAAVNGIVEGKAYTVCLVSVLNSRGLFIGYLASSDKNVLPDSYKEKYYFIIATGLVVMLFCLFLYLKLRSMSHAILDDNQQPEIICESFPDSEEKKVQVTQVNKDLMSNMNHEILSPLNTILGMTRLLLNTELSSRQHSYLTKSHRAAKVLLEIINDILDSSSPESQVIELENVEFDLLDLLDNVLYVTGIQLLGKEIEFTAGMDRNVPSQLKGDYQKLEQALIHLAGNAVQSTEQGKIEIWAELEDTQDNGVSLKFSVQDTGTGIDPVKQKTLFASAYQDDPSMTRKYRGADSGLNIAAGLVKLMGGNIEVESQVGKGSSFFFTLSFERVDSGHLPVDLKDHRVLIVEPKENSAKLLRERIAFLGGFPEVVQTASQALEKLSEGAIHILITSEDLPDMSYKIFQKNYDVLTIVMTEMAQKAGPLNIGNGEIIVSRPLGFQAMIYGLRLLLTGSTTVNRNEIKEYFAPARVLVAEDNPINQRVAQELLQEIGLSVILVSNGQECIECLENEDVDLILMDIQMPELNGFDAARKIRSIPNMENIPIVAMTAYATHDDRVEIVTTGMDDHLAKPLEVKQMIQVLKKWLPLSQERQKGAIIPYHTPESNEELLNKKEALPRFANREDLFNQVLQKVAVDYSDVANQLQAMLDADQMEEGRFLSHTLRGVMGNIGANKIFEVTSRLEECFSNAQKQEASDLIQTLSLLIQTLVSHIQEITSCGESASQESLRSSPVQKTNIRELMAILAKHRPADCSRMIEILQTIKTTENNGLDVDKLIDLIGQYEFDKVMDILSSFMSESESV